MLNYRIKKTIIKASKRVYQLNEINKASSSTLSYATLKLMKQFKSGDNRELKTIENSQLPHKYSEKSKFPLNEQNDCP